MIVKLIFFLVTFLSFFLCSCLFCNCLYHKHIFLLFSASLFSSGGPIMWKSDILKRTLLQWRARVFFFTQTRHSRLLSFAYTSLELLITTRIYIISGCEFDIIIWYSMATWHPSPFITFPFLPVRMRMNNRNV